MNRTSVIVCVILVLSLGPHDGDASPVREKFVVYSYEISPREGESLTLKCFLGGDPQSSIPSPSSYEWIKDGNVIPGETEKTLTLHRLSDQDEGDYQCGPPGSDVPREVYRLYVHRGAQSVNRTFYVQEFGSPVMGQTLTLHCYQSGSSDVHPSIYVWTKNGEVISGETGKTLTLESLTRQDEGDYQCGAPGHGYTRRVHYVKVFSILPKPAIFKDKWPVLGRTSSLSCVIIRGYTINGNMIYTWYKDSMEMKGPSGPVLTFPNVSEADTGEYTCTVRDGPMETMSPSSPVFQLMPLVPPELHIKPTNPDSVMKGILGDNLTLTCEVIRAFPNVPADGYSWSYIPTTKDQPRHLPEKTCTLTLGPLTKQHSGQYQCQAKNNQAHPSVTLIGRASVNLDVVYLENMHLTFDQEVSEGDNVNLTCGVESHPEAYLAWIVHGQVVRHIVGQNDQYIIQSATCSDNTNYTCRATNADMPGREENLTTRIIVDCTKQPPTERPLENTTQALVSAPFTFSLPKQTAMVVVSPHGKDVITICRNCSYVITPEFLPRVLQIYCDQARRLFFFTLSQVTSEDEGTYLCRELGKQRKLIQNCKQKLALRSEESGVSMSGMKIGLAVCLTALVSTIATILLSKHGQKISGFLSQKWDSARKVFRSASRRTQLTEQQVVERRQSLERLYQSGTVYVFPTLVPPEPPATASYEDEASETAPLLAPGYTPAVGEAEYTVKNLVRFMLQQSTGEDDLPSFLLHNTRFSSKEKIILVLSRKLGVVVMIVKAVADVALPSLEDAMKHLQEARKIVAEKLNRFVKTGTIKAAVALPNFSETISSEVRNRIKDFCSHHSVELLKGKEEDLQEWAERLSSRPDSEVWDPRVPGVDSPESAFMTAASHLLTLAGSYSPEEISCHLTAAETWVLTPEQMEVRDSTARLMHIWGPPGSGKTKLLLHRARQWLGEGKAVVLAVGREVYDVLLAYIVKEVRKGQNKEIQQKIRVCRNHSALALALTELKRQDPDIEICLIIDTLRGDVLFRSMIQAVESKEITAVWSVCRDNLSGIDADLSRKARDLGWESYHFTICMRCTDNTVELLNKLQEGSSDHPLINASNLPRTRGTPRWVVVDHCLHTDQRTILSNCVKCKSELTKLQPAHHGVPWNDWIALSTGEPKHHADISSLCSTLKGLGIPASFDQVYSVVASHGTQLDPSETEVAQWLDRVAVGRNEEGNPTVHVVRINDIGGVEKEGVLLVHWDDRDNDLKCQSQEDRDTRLNEHRRQWIRAGASSKGQVILLLLTPSPARSLLNLPEPAQRMIGTPELSPVSFQQDPQATESV